MDDQKPQNQDDQNQPVSIPINEISPPPEEESTGQKINVMSSGGEGDEHIEESDSSAEVTKPAPEPIVDEQIEEDVRSEEQLSPVATPPEEENTQNTGEQQPAEEQKPPTDLFKKDEPTQTSSASPAEMGVAASQMNAQKHPHRNNKKLATVVTIITALILAGTAVFVYMSANKNTDADNNPGTSQLNNSTNQTGQQDVTPATAEDVGQTIAEVEESLSTLDDNTDFNEESLSNETLGL